MASVLGHWLTHVQHAHAAKSASTLPALASQPSIGPVDRSLKSVVAHIRANEVLAGNNIHERLLGEMIDVGVRIATRQTTGTTADWNRLLNPDDIIAIKFNSVGGKALGTTVPMALQLVQSLGRSGFAPDRIILIEVPDVPEIRQLKTQPRVHAWTEKRVSFGSGEEQLDAVLEEATAIINVPFLKTHNIAGMTGCLKNLSHALIRRPKRYHANACAPYVGDIIALPQIRSKLRLHIGNVLRGVFDGGPQAKTDSIWPHSGLLVSTDPVAADAVGTDIINDQRTKAKLPIIGDADGHIPHVHAAAARGLGTDDQDYIDLVEATPF